MSGNSLTLRPAEHTDAPTILAFIRELADYERLSHEVTTNEEELASWLFAERPAAEVVIAEIESTPVGFALFFISFSTFLGRPGIYLEDLYVQPQNRGQGVGRSLLEHLAQIAVTRGYGRLEWAVLDWNESAIGFYERMGAKHLRAWHTYRLSGEALQAYAAKES